MSVDIRLARSRLVEAVEARVTESPSVMGARVGRLLTLPLGLATYRLFAARRVSQFAMAAGGGAFISGLLSRFQLADNEFRTLAHGTYLSMGDIRSALATAAQPGDDEWTSDAKQTQLMAAALVASGDPEAARSLLQPADPDAFSVSPSQHLQTLGATGRPEDVLRLLDRYRDVLGPAEAASVGFDAHWQLGNAGCARRAVEDLGDGQLTNLELITRLRSAYLATGSTADHAYDRVMEIYEAQPCRPDVDWKLLLDFVFNRLDEVVAHASSPSVAARLAPRGRYTLAATAYVQRDFARSRQLLSTLLGTVHHWDAEKLHARMLLEEGAFDEALDNREVRSRLRPALDEVEYFARLHLRRYRSAFRMYLARADANRLRATFGDAADFLPIDHALSRFVIPQDGPGDEISMAATYAQLMAVTDRVTAACDPRLQQLFERSFPDIEFLPTPRQPSRAALGFLADGQPERETGNLYHLLTAEAAARARGADRVVLGRSLIRLTPQAAPYEPYLRPDPELVEQLRPARPTLGVVWRSEYVDPMRSIHFVDPADLAPLAALGCDIVCLQHDPTAEERIALTDVFGDRVVFRDDLDLRNDFETVAALVTGCSGVVGVGTTTTELAAAVGTPTVYLHPNLIGAWRRTDGNADYWHRTMRTAVTRDLRERITCVEEAVLIVQTMGLSST